MRDRKKLLIGVVLGIITALVTPSLVQANGWDIHFGGVTTGIPIVVGWIIGGVIGLFAFLFVIQWVRFNVAHRKRATSREGDTPPKEEGGGNNGP